MTVGWNGKLAGFKVSFGAASAKPIFREDHAIQLGSSLVPVVSFQSIERIYLNSPFTRCLSQKAHLGIVVLGD